MIKNYVEVRGRISVDSGELLGLLDDPDLLGTWEDNGVLHLYWPDDRWTPRLLEELQQTLRRLGQESDPKFTVLRVEEQDWNVNWARSIQPVRLGSRILIRQSWNSAPVPSGGIELIIDPKQAFGTGYHASTQLLVEWLEEKISGGERLLDVGTGSGILAMVALRLGASSALGIDKDPVAIECARENALLNGFGKELGLKNIALEDLAAERFDLIVANLDRKTLLYYADQWEAGLETGGSLLVSGLNPEDYQAIAQALASARGVIRKRRERDDWLALEVAFTGSIVNRQSSIVNS